MSAFLEIKYKPIKLQISSYPLHCPSPNTQNINEGIVFCPSFPVHTLHTLLNAGYYLSGTETKGKLC